MKTSSGDNYVSKIQTADTAVRMIRAGQRVFIGSSCGEPQHLVSALMDNAAYYSDVKIVRLLSVEGSLLALMADEYRGHTFNLRSIYQGSDQTAGLRANKRFITPMNLCAVPNLFEKRLFPLHVALVQVSPPDKHGWMSLGISVDVTLAAAQSADMVIAQVNPKMPRVLGHSFIHLNDVDVIVEHEEDLLSAYDLSEYESADEIASITANLVDDGSTVQLGLAELYRTIAEAFAEKNDLGVHTEILTDDLMGLVARGVVTNRYKNFNEGKLIASVLLEKIAEAARENGITRLVACMLSTNKGMIKLFNNLPYKIETKMENGMLVMRCNFEKETGG